MKNMEIEAEGYYVDENKIIKALDSYFLDVIRYKEYHFNNSGSMDVFSEEWAKRIHSKKKINNSKVASFFCKWLLKAAPIYIVPNEETEMPNDFIAHINSFFVLNCVLYCLLQYDYDMIDQDDYDKLFYDFRYRSIDDRLYFSRFELIEKNIKLKKEIKSLKKSLSDA